jgi:hypothetical protein
LWKQQRENWQCLRLVSKKFYLPVYNIAVLGVLASAELIYRNQKIQVMWESNETIGVYYDRNNVNSHIDFIGKQITAISNGTKIILNTRDEFRIIKSPPFELVEYAINHGKLADIQDKLSKFHFPKYINNPYKLAFKILIEVTDQKFWNWINETNYYLG